ncbi:MAG: hypothetical protein R3C20_25885 [Planctomycetaceae bacterium]
MAIDFVAEISSQLVSNFQTEIRRRTEERTRSTILSVRASEILTFVTPSGRRIEPDVSREYVEALWSFARGNKFQGGELDSAVTQPILKATEDALVEVLNSEAARKVIAESIAPYDGVTESVQGVVGSESIWATREILATAGINPLSFATDPIMNQTSAVAHDLLASTAGKAIMGSIAKIALTAQGKILLARLITAAAGKIAASAAMKVMIMGALKKVGIALIVKAVVVKVLATVAPALIAAKIPIFWIIAPVIGLLIYKEVKNMPAKLADKIPPEIGSEIERTFPEIAREFAQMILADTVRELAQHSSIESGT